MAQPRRPTAPRKEFLPLGNGIISCSGFIYALICSIKEKATHCRGRSIAQRIRREKQGTKKALFRRRGGTGQTGSKGESLCLLPAESAVAWQRKNILSHAVDGTDNRLTFILGADRKTGKKEPAEHHSSIAWSRSTSI
jgi:hypothetical protein